jgi:membrane-associated phospholipid phosphatase
MILSWVHLLGCPLLVIFDIDDCEDQYNNLKHICIAVDIMWCFKMFTSCLMAYPDAFSIKESLLYYGSGELAFDLISTLPQMIFWYSNSAWCFFSMVRMVYFFQMLKPIGDLMRVTVFRLFTQHRFDKMWDFLSLFIFILILAHLCACLWIYLGKMDENLPAEERTTWL